MSGDEIQNEFSTFLESPIHFVTEPFDNDRRMIEFMNEFYDIYIYLDVFGLNELDFQQILGSVSNGREVPINISSYLAFVEVMEFFALSGKAKENLSLSIEIIFFCP